MFINYKSLDSSMKVIQTNPNELIDYEEIFPGYPLRTPLGKSISVGTHRYNHILSFCNQYNLIEDMVIENITPFCDETPLNLYPFQFIKGSFTRHMPYEDALLLSKDPIFLNFGGDRSLEYLVSFSFGRFDNVPFYVCELRVPHERVPGKCLSLTYSHPVRNQELINVLKKEMSDYRESLMSPHGLVPF